MKSSNKYYYLLFFFIWVLNNPASAQDTIIDLSIDRFIRIELNRLKKSESKEYLIFDSVGNYHYYQFYNNYGACKYSKFRSDGSIEVAGIYAGNDSIEFYSFLSPDIKTAILKENYYYRIKPKQTGEWKYFSRDGRLIKTEVYKNDTLVNSSSP